MNLVPGRVQISFVVITSTQFFIKQTCSESRTRKSRLRESLDNCNKCETVNFIEAISGMPVSEVKRRLIAMHGIHGVGSIVVKGVVLIGLDPRITNELDD